MKLGVSSVPVQNTAPSDNITVRTSSLRPTLTVSEVRHGVFFNGTFKIMKISETDQSSQLSLLICDYTENPFLTATPELLGLPPYLNNCLLPLTLWDNFAEEARRLNLKPGDYVYFDNLLGRQVIHSKWSC